MYFFWLIDKNLWGKYNMRCWIFENMLSFRNIQGQKGQRQQSYAILDIQKIHDVSKVKFYS